MTKQLNPSDPNPVPSLPSQPLERQQDYLFRLDKVQQI